MKILEKVRGWFRMFRKDAEKVFGVEIPSSFMDANTAAFEQVIQNEPLARTITERVATLVTLDVKVSFPDDAEELKELSADFLDNLQNSVSKALGGCGVIFKPNGKGVDILKPDSFYPVEVENGKIKSCIFISRRKKEKLIYSRLEYHYFDDKGIYHIQNAGFISDSENKLGRSCELEDGLKEHITIEGLRKPLFSLFKNPAVNRLDEYGPLGIPIFADCIGELRDYRIAWERKSAEIEDSAHTTFVPYSTVTFSEQNNYKLPRYVLGLEGDFDDIKEHVPVLLTEQRIADLKMTLSVIASACGLDPGTLVDDQKGLKTATEVESDQRRTIATVERIRKALKASLDDLFYALAVTHGLSNEGITYKFQDITYSHEEDKKRWYQYVKDGFISMADYLMIYEGLSEDEAKRLTDG